MARLLAVGLVLAACGSSPKHSTLPPTATAPASTATARATTPASTPTAPASTPATPPVGGSSTLGQYLLKQGEGGFEPFAVAVDQPTVADWMKSSQSTAADGRRVVTEGFRDALEQQTATPTGGMGIDFVLELGSAAAARHEQAVELGEDIAEQGHVRVSHFTVAGIPGAAGVSASKGKQGSAANVLFTVGRCLLLVGNGGVDPRYKVDVIAGAQAVYRRTAAGPGDCTPAGSLRI